MAAFGVRNSSVLKHFVDNYFPVTFTCCCARKTSQYHGHHTAKVVSRTKISSSDQMRPCYIPESRTEGQSPRRRMVSTADHKLKAKDEPQNLFLHHNITITVLMVIGALLINILTPVLFPRPTPIVTISDGQVQGKIAYSRDGREYWQFLSIPFAEPPVGALRFAPPQPIKSWEGVKQARSWPPFCLQFEAVITQQVFGKEDCLFLNVNTLPFNNESASRPVLVHIHGGGFLAGSSRIYGPDYFMDENLVVVTLNYRLGPFGFLNFNHDSNIDNIDLPRGNMGLKDQLLALQWVHNNIASFGGDPKRVTIFGESAGSISVHLHGMSPQSRGLFHRAISQSGSAFSSWGFTTQPRQVAQNFAKQLHCPLGNNSQLLDCLQNYDPWEMVKFQVSCTDPRLLKDNLSPSVESVLRSDTFLHEHPTDILESGNFTSVPYAFGVNSADGALRTARFEVLPETVPILQANWTEMLGNVLLFDRLPHSVADLARAFYFENYEKYSDRQSFLDTLTLMFSDVFAFEPVQRAAIAHAKSGAPTYLFYYDYKPRVFPGVYSFFKGGYAPGDWIPTEIKLCWTAAIDWVDEHVLGGKGAHQYGAVHGEDIFQLWNAEGVTKHLSWWELEFSKSFVKAIAEFAEGTNDMRFRGVAWPHITIPGENATGFQVVPYMLMDNSETPRVVPEPFAKRLRFWDSVGVSTFN